MSEDSVPDTGAAPEPTEDGGAAEATEPAEAAEAPEATVDAVDPATWVVSTGGGKAGRRLRWIGALVLVAVLAVAGVEGGLLFWHHQRDQAAAQALAAAKAFTVTLTDVDPATIDEDFAAVIDGSTGEFQDLYTDSGEQLRQLMIDNKAAAHGTVVDAAVKSATSSTVEVVLFVDQSVSNKAVPQAQLDRSRIKITMEKVDGRWLASKVELP